MVISKRCFSLLEIMIVLVIIALLSGVVVTGLMGMSDDAKIKITKITIKNTEDAIKLYAIEKGFPSSAEFPEALLEGITPKLEAIPEDAWGEEIKYQYPSSHGNKFDVWSTGADKEEGGDGLDADIGNWDKDE